ncbi:hypothetical protein RKD54_000445 [Pseudarthrobacter sp. SLBN-100]|jgi:hypothetical protein
MAEQAKPRKIEIQAKQNEMQQTGSQDGSGSAAQPRWLPCAATQSGQV